MADTVLLGLVVAVTMAFIMHAVATNQYVFALVLAATLVLASFAPIWEG